MTATYPNGFTPLNDAFMQMLSAQENCKELESFDVGTTVSLDDFDEWGYPVCPPNPETIATLDRIHQYEGAVLPIERQLRTAIFDEELFIWRKSSNGQMERLIIDRSEWLKEEFAASDIDCVPYPLIGNFNDWVITADFQEWRITHTKCPSHSHQATPAASAMDEPTNIMVTIRKKPKSTPVQAILERLGYFPDRKAMSFGQLRDRVNSEFEKCNPSRAENDALKKLIERLYRSP